MGLKIASKNFMTLAKLESTQKKDKMDTRILSLIQKNLRIMMDFPLPYYPSIPFGNETFIFRAFSFGYILRKSFGEALKTRL